MAQPRAYTQTNTFNDWTTTNPSDPHIGSKFDTEFTELKQNTDDLNLNIALIQRDDGKIKNEAIHKDAFDQDALALIGASGSGFTPKGDWAATTAYVSGDIVNNNDATYLTVTAHTSGSTFAGDKSTYWTLIANSAISTTGASVNTYTSTSGQKVFTTTYAYSTPEDIQVYQNGVLTATTLYSISNSGGNNITFNTAPATGTIVIIWGDAVVNQQAKAATLGYRDTANNHKTTASRWAYLQNATVIDAETSGNSNEYSAKEYAIGTTVAAGSAKDWAVLPENSVVDGGTGYSALHWAAKAAANLVLTNADVVSTGAHLATFQSLFHGASTSTPSSNVSDGDLWFDTNTGVDAMKVYNSDTTAWELISPTASEQTNINTVAADGVDIGRVAGQIHPTNNISTVAGDTTNINIVGDDLSDQFSHIDDHGLITDAVTGGSGTSNITAVAGSIAKVITVADNLANVNNFADVYQIDDFSPSAPTTDGGGNAIAAGDLAYDTTANQLKFYNGSSFVGMNEGDVTGVTAGTGLTGGGTSGGVTLNVVGGTGITANADDIAIDSTVTTLTGSQTLTNKTLTSPILTTPDLGTPSAMMLDFGSIT